MENGFDFSAVPLQNDRVAIVTGANTGLGYETALAFVKKEITVIMACRNKEKAMHAIGKIKKEVPTANLEFIPIDLMDLSTIYSFAETFKRSYQRLDLLINNAGIMIPPFQKTKDEFESQMGVNYFSHFVLTGCLMDLLNATDGSRIVSLSSIAHEQGVINFENLNAEKSYSKFTAYSQSKLACLMFAQELNRKLTAANKSTLSVAAHPGVATTELGRHIPKILYYILYPIFLFMSHKPSKGALPTIMAALDQNVQGGDYFGPTGFRGMKGAPGKIKGKPHAYDEEVAKQLWEESEKLTGFNFTH